MKKKYYILVAIMLVVVVLLAIFFTVELNKKISSTALSPETISNLSTIISSNTNTFVDPSNSVSFVYPNQFLVSSGTSSDTNFPNTIWMANSTDQGTLIATMEIPASYMPKTNFRAAQLMVGMSSDAHAVADCLAALPNRGMGAPTLTTIDGVPFVKFSMGDAGAGNFYNTTSYRTVKNNICYDIEYIIHSTDIGNYSPDQGISAFDSAKITNLLEGIVQSFRIIP